MLPSFHCDTSSIKVLIKSLLISSFIPILSLLMYGVKSIIFPSWINPVAKSGYILIIAGKELDWAAATTFLFKSVIFPWFTAVTVIPLPLVLLKSSIILCSTSPWLPVR